MLEAYVETLEQSLAAQEAGADRLELCGPGEGGLTPSLEVLNSVLDNLKIPTHVMIRPRSGDFCYSDAEFETMLTSLSEVKSAGAAGVVFGILLLDRTLDVARMRTLVEAARPLRVVCHKAFDETPDGRAALEALMELGVDEVLTSGHAKTAIEGASEIAEYV